MAKSTAKKAPAKKAPAKKAPAKKAPVKKAPVKKAPVKKAPVKKAPAKKAVPQTKTAQATSAATAVATKATPARKAVKREIPALPKGMVQCPTSRLIVKLDPPKLTPKQKDRLKTLLLEERVKHLHQAEELQAEADQLVREREQGDTQFDEESGDGDTIAIERERDLILSASARHLVDEIDAALERMKNGTYGGCIPTGRAISYARLEAVPWADLCVDCKLRSERRR